MQLKPSIGSHSDEERHSIWQAATKVGLGVTVGSDFHTPNWGHRPGHMPVIESALPELIVSEESDQ
jgi:hypothetical protein